MKIHVLAENTACSGAFGAEHGLSLYIETEGKRLLFDMGQTALFAENAAKLGVDLSAVDAAFVSHGHYDHGGGLNTFLSLNTKAPVYLADTAFGNYYNAAGKYIGLDKSLENHPRLIKTGEGVTKAMHGISFTDLNSAIAQTEIDSAGLTVLVDDKNVPEVFLHERYLVIEEQGRRIAFSGCAHKGAVNIVNVLRPNIFVGGFHLSKFKLAGGGATRLAQTAQDLSAATDLCYTCHCTGTEQYDFLKTVMGDKLCYLSAGDEIEI